MQVERYNLDKVLLKGTVERITPVMEDRADFIREGEVTRVNEGKRVKYFQVLLQEGVLLKARQVVMATGPTRAHMANIPSWVKSIAESFPEERLQHTVHLMHRLPAARQTLKATDSPSSRLNEASPTQGKSSFLRALCYIAVIQKSFAGKKRLVSFFLNGITCFFFPLIKNNTSLPPGGLRDSAPIGGDLIPHPRCNTFLYKCCLCV